MFFWFPFLFSATIQILCDKGIADCSKTSSGIESAENPTGSLDLTQLGSVTLGTDVDTLAFYFKDATAIDLTTLTDISKIKNIYFKVEGTPSTAISVTVTADSQMELFDIMSPIEISVINKITINSVRLIDEGKIKGDDLTITQCDINTKTMTDKTMPAYLDAPIVTYNFLVEKGTVFSVAEKQFTFAAIQFEFPFDTKTTSKVNILYSATDVPQDEQPLTLMIEPPLDKTVTIQFSITTGILKVEQGIDRTTKGETIITIVKENTVSFTEDFFSKSRKTQVMFNNKVIKKSIDLAAESTTVLCFGDTNCATLSTTYEGKDGVYYLHVVKTEDYFDSLQYGQKVIFGFSQTLSFKMKQDAFTNVKEFEIVGEDPDLLLAAQLDSTFQFTGIKIKLDKIKFKADSTQVTIDSLSNLELTDTAEIEQNSIKISQKAELTLEQAGKLLNGIVFENGYSIKLVPAADEETITFESTEITVQSKTVGSHQLNGQKIIDLTIDYSSFTDTIPKFKLELKGNVNSLDYIVQFRITSLQADKVATFEYEASFDSCEQNSCRSQPRHHFFVSKLSDIKLVYDKVKYPSYVIYDSNNNILDANPITKQYTICYGSKDCQNKPQGTELYFKANTVDQIGAIFNKSYQIETVTFIFPDLETSIEFPNYKVYQSVSEKLVLKGENKDNKVNFVNFPQRYYGNSMLFHIIIDSCTVTFPGENNKVESLEIKNDGSLTDKGSILISQLIIESSNYQTQYEFNYEYVYYQLEGTGVVVEIDKSTVTSNQITVDLTKYKYKSFGLIIPKEATTLSVKNTNTQLINKLLILKNSKDPITAVTFDGDWTKVSNSPEFLFISPDGSEGGLKFDDSNIPDTIIFQHSMDEFGDGSIYKQKPIRGPLNMCISDSDSDQCMKDGYFSILMKTDTFTNKLQDYDITRVKVISLTMKTTNPSFDLDFSQLKVENDANYSIESENQITIQGKSISTVTYSLLLSGCTFKPDGELKSQYLSLSDASFQGIFHVTNFFIFDKVSEPTAYVGSTTDFFLLICTEKVLGINLIENGWEIEGQTQPKSTVIFCGGIEAKKSILLLYNTEARIDPIKFSVNKDAKNIPNITVITYHFDYANSQLSISWGDEWSSLKTDYKPSIMLLQIEKMYNELTNIPDTILLKLLIQIILHMDLSLLISQKWQS
ncbi:hypothetical protein TRFO_26598 [Tritrichomonas foetus]|uniref:Uncharacterized protein n=1 Tax=Tritrichomonas foetus TaxID=1144522 RepID=A0A1J4K3P8_9EUKA|nr:hypothetical protein TRFO_26598 [Tritrichomonas foetus]|eukprot:OHT05594.1 hypothetical protein TRFO_26598 [Tritrichomonas foetus]